MKKSMRFLALTLSLLLLIPSFACNKGEENNSESESISESETLPIEELTDEYLLKYSDCERAEKFIEEKIENSDVPFVEFGFFSDKKTRVSSDILVWTKVEKEPESFIDYPDSDMPVTRNCRYFTYTNEEYSLELDLTLTTYPDFPVVEFDAVLKNTAKGNSPRIYDIKAFDSDCMLEAKRYKLHYNRGSSSAFDDFAPFTDTVNISQSVKLGNYNGLPTIEYLPYFNAENTVDNNGVITAINWQGSWEAEFSLKDGNVCFSANQAGTDFVMLEGESFRLPGIVLLFYKNGDWQYGQNIWRRWILKHNLMRYTGTRDMKQNVYLCSGFEGMDSDISLLQEIKRSGMTRKYDCTFEYDAGWYENFTGSPGGWWRTGDWYPSTTYDEGRLEKVSQTAKDVGAGFCMWFEPERIASSSQTASELKDSIIYLDGENNYLKYENAPKEESNWISGLINYGKQECVDYVVDTINNAVKNYGITMYRQDFNTNNAPYWRAYDYYEISQLKLQRLGVTENKSTTGYLEAWSRIAKENKGLRFDSCAGGGRRNDLETLRFSFMHTKSDYWADQISQQCQNFGAYSWYFFTGTGFLNMNTYDIRTRLTLSIGIGLTNSMFTRDVIAKWSALQKYMFNDYYQISDFNSDPEGKLAMQFDDPSEGGMMVAYLRKGGEMTVTPVALDENKTYRIYSEDDKENVITLSGKDFMENGYLLSAKKNAPTAFVIWYDVIN